MSKLGRWWDSQSVGSQLLYGALVAFFFWLLWAFVGVRVMLWMWSGHWTAWRAACGAECVQQLGQIGDLFGGANALFAAFAFVGVAIAAYYQHRTFQLQVSQQVRQDFEPLFFKLLDRHAPPAGLLSSWGAVQGLIYRPVEAPLTECMATGRSILLHTIRTRRDAGGSAQLTHQDIENHYGVFYAANDGALAPYFRKLFHVFKLIAESRLPLAEKVRYANIARASLNKDELLLLALNCVSREGGQFTTLVEVFGLLKHARVSLSTGPRVEAMIADQFFAPTATMGGAERAKHWNANPARRPAFN